MYLLRCRILVIEVANAFPVSRFDFTTPAWNQLPALLKDLHYRNPDNALDAPLQRAFGSNTHFFGLMIERPDVLNAFQTLMGSYREGRPEFLDIYPADVQLIRGFHASEHPDGVLFVDVGGGRGHEVLEFIRRYPELEGRMILQEVPDIVKQVEPADRMEVMVHDFFTPQPIKGASFCLHAQRGGY